MSKWEGMLLVDKPEGPTSHDLVLQVRRLTGQRRIGHAGTLDPMASGLLPLLLGRATRLLRFLPHSPKTYVGELRLGLRTDTDDITGAVVERSDRLPAESRVHATARELEGPGRQVPPAFSARKLGGRRMYDLARRGVEVQAPATEIEVHGFALTATREKDTYRFSAEVSVGTYVRGLVRDLGHALGCGAALARLRRTRIGPMNVEASVSPDGATDPGRLLESLIPLEQMPLVPPVLRLDDPEAVARFEHGRAIASGSGPVPDGVFRILTPTGRLLGVAETSGGQLLPRVVLAAPESR